MTTITGCEHRIGGNHTVEDAVNVSGTKSHDKESTITVVKYLGSLEEVAVVSEKCCIYSSSHSSHITGNESLSGD